VLSFSRAILLKKKLPLRAYNQSWAIMQQRMSNFFSREKVSPLYFEKQRVKRASSLQQEPQATAHTLG